MCIYRHLYAVRVSARAHVDINGAYTTCVYRIHACVHKCIGVPCMCMCVHVVCIHIYVLICMYVFICMYVLCVCV